MAGARNQAALAAETLALAHRFPNSDVRVNGRKLVWRGQLRPTDSGPWYRVEVRYQSGSDPVTRVLDPLRTRPGLSLPHVWNHENQILCLFEDGDWQPGLRLAESIVPWASEWLFFYEIWLVTGEWDGGGRWPPVPARLRTAV